MLAIAASCTVSEIDSIKGTTAPEITASYENNGSKTTITTDEEGVGTIWWKPADEINVFYGTLSVHYTSKNKENATTVAFGTTDIIGSTESASENIWGLYPYNENAVCDGESVTTTIPATQQAIAGSFDDDIFTSLAHSTSTVMTFYNVLGGIKFSLSRDDIQTITFKGNNDEDIAGKVKLEMDANGKPVAEVIEGEKTITLTPKEGTTFAKNTNYYIVMLPAVLSNGFTMTFETEDEVGTFEYTTKSIEIKRSVFSKKENIDSYATFKAIPPAGAVDLGLSVMWATCNIGADSPEEYGGYYQWAGLKDVSNINIYLDFSNCPYHTGSSSESGFTKYIPTNKSSFWSGAGNPDNKTILEAEDDIAYILLGGKWRMPTKEEFEELNNPSNCTWTLTIIDGVSGYKVTSVKSGYTDKWIFLPSSRSRYYNSVYDPTGYWSSSLYVDPVYNSYSYRPDSAFSFLFGSDGGSIIGSRRFAGLSVRPVYGERKCPHNLVKYKSKSPTFNESGYKEYFKCSNCYKYYEDAEGTILIGDDFALQAWKSEGGAGYLPPLTLNSTYIDLGLSVKWAVCNLGASRPEEYGAYFQWAGTQVTNISTYLSENNCPYYSNGRWAKYVPTGFSSYWSGPGTPDNKSVLDSEDDAANVKLGETWHIPTINEWEELNNNCTWIWTTINGVNGFKVTSTITGYTDKYIFLPAAGLRYYDFMSASGSQGWYWSSSLNLDSPEEAHALYFDLRGVYSHYNYYRYYAMSVRPVLE